MIGTIANTIAILTGSTIGNILKKGIRGEYQSCLFTAMGLAALGIGINAVVSNMPKSQYPVLFIISLALGSLIGTASRLEYRFQHLLDRFSLGYLGTGLSTAILMFCIGTLSILGPIEAAVHGNHTYLFTNATLDFITSMALASTYGIGIAIAAGVLFLWQGSIYMGAGVLSGFLVPELMCEVSVVGGFLIAASGLSILKVKDCHSMNMLPALLVPPLWFVIKGFVGL